MGEFLGDIVLGICGALIGGLIWGIRLEGLVKQCSRDLERAEKNHENLVNKHETLEHKIMEKVSAVCESLARIEEKLKSKKERTLIKED